MRGGNASVALFQRNVNGFISTLTSDVPDGEFGTLRLTRPFNSGRGRIRGFEAGFRTFLRASFLSDFLDNFGVLANYTYIDATNELPALAAGDQPGRQAFTNVSKHIANAAVFYENKVMSLRAAYNYRSSFVSEYSSTNADPVFRPLVEDGRGSLDVNATLSPVENITLYASATNILGEAAQNRRAFNDAGDSFPFQTRFLESVYRLGVRFRF
ncbi:hypothetical protein A6F68_00804 [Tsuneonella dongtanensis]|uniref:TonB-dependent receptor-like beta-barrel domain-containing protein n=2 Tax=Tsuneonella dongtanensis TaxID=692370 RepID=A0A1B2AAZ0_9SPHN|nr:hypothetical protein A6F68_00804 [Tsuneonella dongtanensis]